MALLANGDGGGSWRCWLMDTEGDRGAAGSRRRRRTLSLVHGENRVAVLELIHDMAVQCTCGN